MRRTWIIIVLLISSLPTRLLRAQTPDSGMSVAVIPAADVAHHLGVLAADSLRSRTTPSHALDLTAQYIADAFERFGLKPAPNPEIQQPVWIQRYPVPGQQRVDPIGSTLALMVRLLPTVPNDQKLLPDTVKPQIVNLSLASTAYFSPEVGPQRMLPTKRMQVFSIQNLLSLGKPVAVV